MNFKKRIAGLTLAFLIISASVIPAFADGRRHHDRGGYHPYRQGVGIGLGILGLGILVHESLRYRERVYPRVCNYEPAGYVWNPNWQRWDAVWVLVCR